LVLLGLTAALMLAGCSRDTQGASGEARGRYGGIGLYPAGQMWAQLAHPAPGNPAAARLDDDEQIIVVIDSRTGEVRQCGNVSGYCVALNPWGGALAVGQRAPLPLAKHADQLEREAAAAAKPSPSR
jgi:hypothetical protein